ncbi:MAG: precorrin-3B C(17)-methyltransferase [Pseudomonadota bacterium]
MPSEPCAVVVFGRPGLATAEDIVAALPAAELHAPPSLTADADVPLDEVVDHLRELFAAGRAIVGVCAAGILVRALAPLLGDKHTEPPVVAVAADGRSIVPLLGGHHGANALAKRLAAALGGHAAVTTASETVHGVVLDEPPPGWRWSEAADLKPLLARLRDGGRLVVDDRAVRADWLAPIAEPVAEAADAKPADVLVTAATATSGAVALHPQVLALGIGCERGCEPAEVTALAEQALASADLAPKAVAVIVSLDLKADEPAVTDIADALDVPARFFDAPTLEAMTPRLANPSPAVFREVGCHGVAEAAALAATGAAGWLVVPKLKSRRATAAVAQALAPLTPAAIGRAPGRLLLLSLGPGGRDQRTRAVDQALRRCTDLVGYSGYLALIEPAVRAERHGFPLGGEVDRCRFALDLAATGRTVGLVGSGDVGVYAMAALVEEVAADGTGGRSVTVDVLPGVSAMHVAAARVGAPLGHDFCAISLSDLLTPREVIDRRLAAAAAGDFVVALYNPVSRTRRDAFVEAKALLAAARPPDTPCVVARQLGRDGETVRVVPLAELSVDDVDMFTLVLVGASQTRTRRDGRGRTRAFTPRGYQPA